MKEKIEILNPHTGKPIIVEIDKKDWIKFKGSPIQVAHKEFVICFAYVMSFTKNLETGSLDMVYFEETRAD